MGAGDLTDESVCVVEAPVVVIVRPSAAAAAAPPRAFFGSAAAGVPGALRFACMDGDARKPSWARAT